MLLLAFVSKTRHTLGDKWHMNAHDASLAAEWLCDAFSHGKT
jgi:hypothetical protein